VYMDISPGAIRGADVVVSYPDEVRAGFENVLVDLARTTEFADIYVGTGEDDDVCLIISYSEESQAATCVPAATAAERGLLLAGRDSESHPVEIVMVVPSDTVRAALGGHDLDIVDSIVATRVSADSMSVELVTERGSTIVDYDPADIREVEGGG